MTEDKNYTNAPLIEEEMEIDLMHIKNAIKDTFSFFTNTKGELVPVGKNAIISPGRFANGGFPELGEMFIARENGPELVGRMGNQNAVANNSQIIEGITQGAYRGVYRAMLDAMSGQSDGKQVNVNVYLEGDAGKLFRVIQKEGQSYVLRTGKEVFDG